MAGDLLAIIAPMAAFGLLALLALLFGAETRPGFDERPVLDDRPNWPAIARSAPSPAPRPSERPHGGTPAPVAPQAPAHGAAAPVALPT